MEKSQDGPVDPNSSEVIVYRELCRERLDEKLSEVDKMKAERLKWRGRYRSQVNPRTSLEQLSEVMRDPHTSQCAKLNDEHNAAVEYIVIQNQKHTTVKSERLVAACILAEAKLSITSFNQDYFGTMQKYKNHMDYAPWVPYIKDIKVNIVNTDTDSLCFWTHGYFKNNSLNGFDDRNDTYEANTNAHIPSEQEFSDFKEFLLHTYMKDKLDTANYHKNDKYSTNKFKKDQHRFQRDVVDPRYIRRIIAVNPKEYFVEHSDDKQLKSIRVLEKYETNCSDLH